MNFNFGKQKKNIAQFVSIVNGDNTLLLDLEQEICFQLLKKAIKNKTKILLEEFLFSQKSVVKDDIKSDYVNQFIVSFYHKN